MAAMLTLDDLFTGFQKFSDTYPVCNVGLETLFKLKEIGNTNNEEIESYISWCRSREFVKVIDYPVPDDILPAGYKGTLHDVRVQPARWKPDDYVYENNADIREKVARGNSILTLTLEGQTQYLSVARGLNKFTGGLGDDDDSVGSDEFVWEKFFSKPITEANTVVSLSKANGESAHFSAFILNGSFMLCAGSKNVHLIFNSKADISKYREQRFGIAREVAETVLEELGKLEEENKNRFLSFLSQTNCTAVFELIHPSHQHVESFEHITSPELHFISWVSNNPTAVNSLGFCALSPHVGIEMARSFGLHTVNYVTVKPSEAESHMTKIRRGIRYEGEVMYFLDGGGRVIGMVKKKTAWYIIVRALREKTRNACRQITKEGNGATVIENNKVRKRILEIQKWLQLDDRSTGQWERLCVGFFRWCCNNFKSDAVKFEQVQNYFPQLWQKYLAETEQSDDIEVTTGNKS